VAANKIVDNRASMNSGFSLLELVVVLAVMAVLLTIAVPSYRQYIQRIERADAIRLLLAVADCQERIRANTGLFDTTHCLEGMNHSKYSLTIEPAGNTASPGFEAIAEPNLSEGDSCGALSLDHTGTRSISSENGTLSACWGGR
jgi:type IV pilus assembly protein PilE